MSYIHIENLYRLQTILLFKECYAMEKIHGTSANITWDKVGLAHHSGGEKYEKFVSLFDNSSIYAKFIDMGFKDRKVTIYGEAYGGKCQGMSETYGNALKFIAFDVCIDETNWLNVPEAEAFCKSLGIEFVHYVKISTDLKEIDAQRDADSVQAVRNGITVPKKREGVVLRPLVEFVTSTGSRAISKHKGDAFRETASPRVVEDPSKLKILEDANAIANEWVTETRLQHVLDKIPTSPRSMGQVPQVINAMNEDIAREAAGEIVYNDAVKKAISVKTVAMYKSYLQFSLK